MSNSLAVEAVFKAIDKVSAPVNRMQNSINKMTRESQSRIKSLSRSMDKIGDGFKRHAVRVAAIGAVGATGLYKIISAGAEFEQAITNVGAVTLKSREQISGLEQQALKLGATTQFTATQAANAMEVLARAGFETNDIMEATPAVLSAAAASGLEIAEVANHVSNVLKGMGLATNQAARVSDVLALASARTNSSIGSLGESMKNVSSTARQLGVPLESAVAAVALLQDVGLDASVAGSSLNVMLTNMAKPSKEVSRAMRRFGISFKDAKGNMLPFEQVLSQLNEVSKKFPGNFDKVAFMSDLVGLRGQKAAANLADLFESKKVQELTKQLQNAAGAADKMANIRMNTFYGSLLLLSSAIDALSIKIFNMQKGSLKDVVDLWTKWVGVNGDLIATKIGDWLMFLTHNLGTIFTWIKRVGIAIAVFFTLNTILKTISVTMGILNVIMAMNPIGLIIIGVSSLVAGISALIYFWDSLSTSVKVAFIALGLLTGPIGWLITAGTLLYKNWSGIQNFFGGLFAGIKNEFIELKNYIASWYDWFSGVGNKIKSFFGFGSDNNVNINQNSQIVQSQVISPQERLARNIEERRSINEIIINDNTNRAEISQNMMGPGLILNHTGGF